MKIDEDLLVKNMESFVGFGSYEADFWFVGTEQRWRPGLEELGRRPGNPASIPASALSDSRAPRCPPAVKRPPQTVRDQPRQAGLNAGSSE